MYTTFVSNDYLEPVDVSNSYAIRGAVCVECITILKVYFANKSLPQNYKAKLCLKQHHILAPSPRYTHN